MKLFKYLIASVIMLGSSQVFLAQDDPTSGGGQFVVNPDGVPCLTDEDYVRINADLEESISNLETSGLLASASSGGGVLFDWPVAQAAGFDYNSTWSISNYVDHNPASGVLEDYNCGPRTYDTPSGYDHQGLDIFTWPFWWKQVDEEQTHVVAAADGQIVFKSDGNFDRNCAFNSDFWNAVYVRHSDGSVAWYGHMKDGSLTTKGVGEFVSQGEYLGVIASSGNSTGPHLHFEVYDIDNNLIDPYEGPCNGLNPNTWWASQKPYINPQINAVLTHTAPPDFGTCPATETTNESDEFEPFDTVYLGSYFKDQQPGTSSFNQLIDPDNNVYFSWTRNFTVFYYASWWWQSVNLNDNEGTWIYRVSYNGETVDHEFTVNTLGVNDNELEFVTMAPNPTQSSVRLQSQQPMTGLKIYDLNGRLLSEQDVNSSMFELNVSGLQSGMYFVRILGEDGSAQSLRLIKN